MSCVSRINLCPASGDTENVLLQKILQALNAGAGGGGGSGITSVNGNSGPAVLLTTSDIPEGTNLYFTDARAIAATSGAFLLKAGDTGTGPFIFSPSAANATPLTLSNSVTGAGTAPSLALAPTWDTSGAPTALDINVLNTTSNAASLIFNTRLNSTTVLNLRVDGRLSLTGRVSAQTISPLGHIFSNLDAINTAPTLALTIGHSLSSGTAAAGFGTILDWNLDSTTTVFTRAARWTTTWTDATHATRTAQTSFVSFQAGVEVTNMVLANGQVQGNDGSAGTPAFADRNDTNTGIYFPAADTIGLSTGGTVRLTLSTTTLTSTVPILGPAGTSAAPSHSFSGDTNTGIFSSVADILSFSAGGTARATVTTTAVNANVPFRGPSASEFAPAFSFEGDTDTGIYLSSSGTIAFSSNGTPYITFSAGGEIISGVAISATQLRTPAGVPAGQIFLGGVGSSFIAESGVDGRLGNVTLVAGTETVAVPSVTANTLVLLTRKTSGGTIGTALTYTLSVGTSFTITSDNILDTSTITYFLIEAPPG